MGIKNLTSARSSAVLTYLRAVNCCSYRHLQQVTSAAAAGGPLLPDIFWSYLRIFPLFLGVEITPLQLSCLDWPLAGFNFATKLGLFFKWVKQLLLMP